MKMILKPIACLLIGLVTGLPSPFLFPSECGVNYIEADNIRNTGRIVGGFEAVPGSWPWQAYIIKRGIGTCGGTLIHPEWVLSAAHCFHGEDDPTTFQVILGEHDYSYEEGSEQTINVEKFISHPQYNKTATDFDLTLIKLSKPVDLTDRVAPACFPDEDANLETTFPPEQVCIVSGWGSIDSAGELYGKVLKQEYAQLFSNEECGKAIGNPSWITDRMICAGLSFFIII